MGIVGHVDNVSHHFVVGWAADTDQPNRALEVLLVVDGSIRARIPASEGREGLQHAFPGATGRYQFSLELFPCLTKIKSHAVEILVKEGETVSILGRRSLSARSGEQAEPMPLLVTSTGRSGTTLLMREFARQNTIVVADAYPYEVKIASYYASTLEVLACPRFCTDASSELFADIAFKERRAVPNPWNQPDLNRVVGGPHLQRLIGDAVPTRMAALFRNAVLEYYDTIRIFQDKPPVRYFAEKSAMSEPLRPALRRLFGRLREIVLVRDPRDYLCSAKSFWNVDSAQALNSLKYQIDILERIHQESANDVLFVRYEDLILDPSSSRRAVYDFLGIGCDEVNPVELDGEMLRLHATTADPVSSVGRWRHDLGVEEIAACDRAFGSFMRRFRYEFADTGRGARSMSSHAVTA